MASDLTTKLLKKYDPDDAFLKRSAPHNLKPKPNLAQRFRALHRKITIRCKDWIIDRKIKRLEKESLEMLLKLEDDPFESSSGRHQSSNHGVMLHCRWCQARTWHRDENPGTATTHVICARCGTRSSFLVHKL